MAAVKSTGRLQRIRLIGAMCALVLTVINAVLFLQHPGGWEFILTAVFLTSALLQLGYFLAERRKRPSADI